MCRRAWPHAYNKFCHGGRRNTCTCLTLCRELALTPCCEESECCRHRHGHTRWARQLSRWSFELVALKGSSAAQRRDSSLTLPVKALFCCTILWSFSGKLQASAASSTDCMAALLSGIQQPQPESCVGRSQSCRWSQTETGRASKSHTKGELQSWMLHQQQWSQSHSAQDVKPWNSLVNHMLCVCRSDG